MMMRKLRLYLWWKGKLSQRKQDGKPSFGMPDTNKRTKDNIDKVYGDEGEISEALKKKDKEKAERSQSRRRVRGGGPVSGSASRVDSTSFPKPEPKVDEIENEADGFAQLWVLSYSKINASLSHLEFQCSWQSQGGTLISELPISLEDDNDIVLLDFGSDTLGSDFDMHYGLLKPEETVLIRAYSDDTDDRMLTEIKPKFIVMFEPDMDFVRRVEVSLP